MDYFSSKAQWRDDLDAYNSDWWEDSKDREVWRQNVEAFAQQWDSKG